ncbi:MAG: polysaccharide pyruvyl transferase family protein [Prevotella sp.]|nr:polysaccharide pyruvyl transferase family protein [Prevotella sp.]
MKIGIITYAKCDNYGAELQAFALQWKLNKLGYDAEVVNLEKRHIDMKRNPDVIWGSIKMRIKRYGFKGLLAIYTKSKETKKRMRVEVDYKEKRANKHKLFEFFFDEKVRHSNRYYTLDEITVAEDLPYDTYIAGSDQIWNYIHTDRLDVYFLMFANKYNAKKISYAASISIYEIPRRMRKIYGEYIRNIDVLSVRELQGAELIMKYWKRKTEVVLDPTFLLQKEEWEKEVAKFPDVEGNYLLIYTLSGSPHIRKMAIGIARQLNLTVVNIKSNYIEEPNDGTIHFYEIGPEEWVGLLSNAKYVVTDSFHGTAFSINFNIPFTILVNPVSMMNSRVLSILKITGLESRIVYDELKDLEIPKQLEIDFESVNSVLNEWKKKSIGFLETALKQN